MYNFMSLKYPETIQPDETWGIVDPSKLTTFMRCPRKFFYLYVLGWKVEEVNIHLTFGSAYHSAMEVLMLKGIKEENIDEAFAAFLEQYRKEYSEITDSDNAPKNPQNALIALQEYVEKYKKNDYHYKTLFTEIFITAPIDDNGRVISGRMDAIREHDERGIIGVDFKTGSRRTGFWESQWKNSIQMSTYYHFLNMIYKPEKVWGMIVDGMFFYKRQQKGEETRNIPVRVPIRKTNALHQAFLSDLNTWIDLLEWSFEGLSQTKVDDVTMTAFPCNSTACTDYMKLCPFHNLCTSWSNPVSRCETPPVGFEKKFWNPKDDQTKPPIKHFIDLDKKEEKNNDIR